MQAVLCRTASPLELSSKARIGKGFGQACSPVRASSRRMIARMAVAFKEDEERSQTLGERVEQAPYKAPPEAGMQGLMPAFTRRREHIVGRIAMLGVAACWAGELLTGAGPMSQLAYELNVPRSWAFWSTCILALGQLVLALNKGSATFSPENQLDVSRRSKGITGISAIEPDTTSRVGLTSNPGKWFLRSELLLGRMAMLIFAGAMITEFWWNGESPLAHLGLITAGVPLAEAPLWLKIATGVFVAGGLGLFSLNDTRRDPDTY